MRKHKNHGDENSIDEHDHRGPRGRGRPGQYFESGELSLLILHLISATPRHGYELMKLIENELSGAFAPSPGVIYPTLMMLEEMGFAAVTSDGARKLYSITKSGKKELANNKTALNRLLARMKEIGQCAVRQRPAQLVRAMDNLRMVLRMRGGKLSQEELHKAVDIIDAAAKQIERL